MKLWQKNYNLNKEIEKFTVGNDHLIDLKLVEYDCIASIAHAKMLKKIGILSNSELSKLEKGLNEIIKLNQKGKFVIKQEDEDCHTAIENYLTKKLGKVGEKIHTARSRNDQVLTALRLYEKKELTDIKSLIIDFQKSLSEVIKQSGSTKIPGYTHMQKAMPTDIKTWLGSYLDSSKDNVKLLEATYSLIDQSPLGSGAGYGIPIKTDNKYSAKLLGFSKVMENPSYAQMSRGKFEADLVDKLSLILLDLNKLASDLILYNMKEFGYVSLPKEFCTGSSIMPQKKNPDVLELMRAKYHIVLGESFKIKSLVSNLISGYNRDLQLTKEPVISSIEITKSCLQIMNLLISKLKINKDACKKAMTPELFATEEAYKLVKKGMPFRQAYKKIGKGF